MKKTGKKNRKKPVILLLLFLFFGMFFWGLYMYSSEENHEKVEHNNTETTTKPTPTKCPDVALPTLWMNGKLYKVDPLDESVVAYEEEDYVGSVESCVAYNQGPTKEMESNTLPVGTPIYKDRHARDLYVAIVSEKFNTYYFRLYEVK